MTERGGAHTEPGRDPHVTHLAGRELPPEDIVVPEAPPARVRSWPERIVYLIAGLALFVAALGLMRRGAEALIPLARGVGLHRQRHQHPRPRVAGRLPGPVGLAGRGLGPHPAGRRGHRPDRGLHHAHRLPAGRRLRRPGRRRGLLAALKGQGSRRAPVSIGVLSLLMTAVVYVPGALVGWLLLDRGVFDGLDIGTSPELTSATDSAFGWLVDAIVAVAPSWTLFPVGLGLLLLGFQAFDRVLPAVGATAWSSATRTREGDEGWTTRLWPMFLAGCAVTMLTLSVSVSLTLLVPLVAKGHVRRANTLPVHRRGQHHDADRHPRRRRAPRQPGRGAGRRRRHPRGHGVDPLPPRDRLPAAAAHPPRPGPAHPGQQPPSRPPSPPPCSSSPSASSPSDRSDPSDSSDPTAVRAGSELRRRWPGRPRPRRRRPAARRRGAPPSRSPRGSTAGPA